MELFIYSDESGVFDKKHNKYYVYGGLIFLSSSEKDNFGRIYLGAERNISKAYPKGMELKASKISNKHKKSLCRVLRPCSKFGAVVSQDDILENIFESKKSKQRYLDYVYKLSLKNAFEEMQKAKIIDLADIEVLHVYVDEHTTATDGKYELKESLEQEFKIGTFNFNYSLFHKPIFPNLRDVQVHQCNSDKVTLIRAADLWANHIYYRVMNNKAFDDLPRTYIKYFP